MTSIEWLVNETYGLIDCKESYFDRIVEKAKEKYNAEQETLYTEEQVREAIEDARDILSHVNTDEVIKSLKQPKKD
jgi:hypothetical protein